jgi:hypothetical protein
LDESFTETGDPPLAADPAGKVPSQVGRSGLFGSISMKTIKRWSAAGETTGYCGEGRTGTLAAGSRTSARSVEPVDARTSF